MEKSLDETIHEIAREITIMSLLLKCYDFISLYELADIIVLYSKLNLNITHGTKWTKKAVKFQNLSFSQ